MASGEDLQQTTKQIIAPLDNILVDVTTLGLKNLDKADKDLKRVRNILIEIADIFTAYSTELELMIERLDTENE